MRFTASLPPWIFFSIQLYTQIASKIKNHWRKVASPPEASAWRRMTMTYLLSTKGRPPEFR
jgi:hypothetical protein